MHADRRPPAFTLVELIIVITIMSIIAALMIPNVGSTEFDKLLGVGRIMAGDLAYARSLAVSNSDRYLLTFNLTTNQYTLTHSGTNATLNTLPRTSFSGPADTSTQHVVSLATDFPQSGMPVSLYKVVAATSPAQTNITTVEFGPLGSTTQTAQTTIWLTTGKNAAQRYLPIVVNPVTGLATIGSFTAVCN